MNNQTKEIINNSSRTKLNDDLRAFEEQKVITQSEAKQMKERLNADFDYYLEHRDIDLQGLEKMFFETIKSFENIKINRKIFNVISLDTYWSITSQIAMRNFPPVIKQEDYVIQSDLNKVMNNWFENYQSDTKDREAIAE